MTTKSFTGSDSEQLLDQLYQNQDMSLQDLLRLKAAVFHHMREGIILCDNRGAIQYVNPSFTAATGYVPHEVIGENPRILQSGWHNEDFYTQMWKVVHEQGHWHGEIWNRRKNGEIYPQQLHILAVHDNGGQITQYIALFNDITDHKEHEVRLHHQALHDALTGLPNRLLFMDRLSLAVQDAQRLGLMAAVMFLDLDRFKMINDTLGHTTGDHLLQFVAQRLLDAVRDTDTVCRLGGDEFTIIMENIPHVQDAVSMAQHIMDIFMQPFEVEGHEFFLTPSIGIALYPNDGEEIETLVKNADSAMYRAKEHGNNFQLYTPTMNAQGIERLELDKDLRKAITRDEFSLNYQPQVNIETGEIIGMEALLRWNHGQRGLISPAVFIPVAEETGLIVQIGEWVLRTAIAQAKQWIDAGYPPLRIAVNLSARQFQQRNLVSIIDRVLHETGLPAQYLEVEITESITMHDVEHAITTMYDLNDLGVQISIDDFGTGYSSLSYLKKFPIQTLKIDQSFVRDITDDPDDAAIAASIIALAKSLRLNVIAEGVETVEQLSFLRDMQCDEMQGYLFSRPVPAEEFEKLLTKRPIA